MKLWGVATGQEWATLVGHAGWVAALSFSADGTILATGSHDQTIKLWDAATGQDLATLRGHTGNVYSVAFSPDDSLLASGSLDGTVRLWDVARTLSRRAGAAPRGASERHDLGDARSAPFRSRNGDYSSLDLH